MFSTCVNLTSIPVGFLDACTGLTNVSNLFYNSFGLTSIPTTLFDRCPLITNYTYCFGIGYAGNPGLIYTVPLTLFDTNAYRGNSGLTVVNLSYCFNNRSSINSDVPKLWHNDYFPKLDLNHRVLCFGNCPNIPNETRLDMPGTWGGLKADEPE
jgi:hypothetical protein